MPTTLAEMAVDGSGLKNLVIAVGFFFTDSLALILCALLV